MLRVCVCVCFYLCVPVRTALVRRYREERVEHGARERERERRKSLSAQLFIILVTSFHKLRANNTIVVTIFHNNTSMFRSFGFLFTPLWGRSECVAIKSKTIKKRDKTTTTTYALHPLKACFAPPPLRRCFMCVCAYFIKRGMQLERETQTTCDKQTTNNHKQTNNFINLFSFLNPHSF